MKLVGIPNRKKRVWRRRQGSKTRRGGAERQGEYAARLVSGWGKGDLEGRCWIRTKLVGVFAWSGRATVTDIRRWERNRFIQDPAFTSRRAFSGLRPSLGKVIQLSCNGTPVVRASIASTWFTIINHHPHHEDDESRSESNARFTLITTVFRTYS